MFSLFKGAAKRSLRWVMKQQSKPRRGPKKMVVKPFVSSESMPESGVLIPTVSE